MRLSRLILATFLVAAGFVVSPFGLGVQSAQAAVGALSIVATGGSSEGTGWSYSSGTITLTTNVSINASDIVAKLALADLVVDVASITVSADVTSPSSSSLTLKSNGNIVFTGGSDIETAGGSIILQSDSDASGRGYVRLGLPTDSGASHLRSNGGNIYLSGGLNPATGYAMADTTGNPTGYSAAGVSIYGYEIESGAGNVVIRGSSQNIGNTSTRTVFIRKNSTASSLISATGAGAISINGDASVVGHNNAWAVDIEENATLRTVNGPIQLTGLGGTGAQTNSRGFAIVNVSFESTSGAITLDDLTNGATVSGYSGTYNGGTASFSTLGDVILSADEFANTGTWVFVGPNNVLRPFNASSFTAAQTIGAVTAANSQNLTIGSPGNTAAMTMNVGITSGGHVTIHGSSIALNAALTAPASNIYLYASSTVTQSGALVADGLALVGAGTFNLPNVGNNVRVLAGGSSSSKLGSVTFVDAVGGLTIGQVSALAGLSSSGVISVSTVGGNLTLLDAVVSSLGSGDSVLLYADKPATSGTAGNGNILLSGNASLAIESGARALLYSGSQINSTGLIALVGGDANTRSSVDATTALNSITPVLGATGQYALFRLAEVVPTPTPTPSDNPSPASLPTTGFDFAFECTLALGLLLTGLGINLTSGLRRRRKS